MPERMPGGCGERVDFDVSARPASGAAGVLDEDDSGPCGPSTTRGRFLFAGHRPGSVSRLPRLNWQHLAVLVVAVALAVEVVHHGGSRAAQTSVHVTATYPSAASDSALLAVADRLCRRCVHEGLVSVIPDSLRDAVPGVSRVNGYALRCAGAAGLAGLVVHAFTGDGLSLLFVAVAAAGTTSARIASMVGAGPGDGISTVSGAVAVTRTSWRLVTVMTSGRTDGLRLPVVTSWMRVVPLPDSAPLPMGACS
jgi:hypothetical protein